MRFIVPVLVASFALQACSSSYSTPSKLDPAIKAGDQDSDGGDGVPPESQGEPEPETPPPADDDAGALPADDAGPAPVSDAGAKADATTAFVQYDAIVTANTGLNLRKGPSTSDIVLLVLATGTTVRITGPNQNNFSPLLFRSVQGKQTSGWGYSTYLKKK